MRAQPITIDYAMNMVKRGVELFVYGKHDFGDSRGTTNFPARQSLEASMAIARKHGLSSAKGGDGLSKCRGNRYRRISQ